MITHYPTASPPNPMAMSNFMTRQRKFSYELSMDTSNKQTSRCYAKIVGTRPMIKEWIIGSVCGEPVRLQERNSSSKRAQVKNAGILTKSPGGRVFSELPKLVARRNAASAV